ncbi:BZ3500_MvSof-1268-A1-R1_Chr2-1g04412 [Microbotryum saponariae]|uniref:BZ3500_MvSof-1268-A1-R1_Chr2-1g04412 protein n=1 Tax=Microbotryum saponariae TaxID=289078 RepID=A0A2X0M2R2_9BASI|nr:BZ3500_MvSof-1268-A1-R1_Chr2-1g04412 [Microbotryum saponariae]SCZ91626.1 BZ3501_MvSof-1269-A2-R1_Chr2-1g04068 [Microbotryum saponariae]
MLIAYSASTPPHLEPEEVSLALSDSATAIAQARNTIVMLGAGASTKAGIADFRSKGTGLYSRQTHHSTSEAAHAPFSDEASSSPRSSQASTSSQFRTSSQDDPTPTQLRSFFSSSSFRNPSTRVQSLEFFASFKNQVDQSLASSPSSRGVTNLHRFLGELKVMRKLGRVYSQNIDGFERSGGLSNVELGAGGGVGRERGDTVQLHGTVQDARCSECDHEEWCGAWVVQEWASGEKAECPKCQARSKRTIRSRSYLRPSIVLYDELIPHSETIVRLANHDILQIDCLLVCGSSLRIDGFVKMARSFAGAVRARGGMCVLVNRERVASSWEVFHYHVMADCDEFVNRIRTEWRAADPQAWRGVKKRQRAFIRSVMPMTSMVTKGEQNIATHSVADFEHQGRIPSAHTRNCSETRSDLGERSCEIPTRPTKKTRRTGIYRTISARDEIRDEIDMREAREIVLMAETILKKHARRKRTEESSAGGRGGRRGGRSSGGYETGLVICRLGARSSSLRAFALDLLVPLRRAFPPTYHPPTHPIGGVLTLELLDSPRNSSSKMAELEQLAQMLTSTLDSSAATRRQAERNLLQIQTHPSFGVWILQLAQDGNRNKTIRQSAALNFKNWIKANWALEEAPTPLTSSTAEGLKQSVVAIMISLANAPALQVQIGEAIAIMAEADFPDRWENLIDQLVQSLTPNDFVVNNAVLQTAHSIFRRWRSEFRTDILFLEIKFVLDRFCAPYQQLFQQTDALLSSPTLTADQHALLLKTILLLLQIYHDLNSQDLPEFFEDRLGDFMTLLLKYLDYSPPAALQTPDTDDDDEEAAGDMENIKAEVCEIAQLYSLRYLDAFGEGGYLGPFVQKTWELLTKLGLAVKYDGLVSKATGFLGVVAKMPSQRALFDGEGTFPSICEKILLPNMTLRTFEEEMFEDDAPEYVRRDLESASSETRRQAASDFTKALMEQFESQVTKLLLQYVGAYLSQYEANPATNWKSKDTAIFLLTSIASRGSTAQHGVTSTNALVDVVDWFSKHVLGDLQAAPGSIHPIILSDAIKFIYTFRNQLTKEQLLAVLPLLVPHIEHPSFVIHTYASITIERILFIKQNGAFLCGQADIRPYSENILNALFKVILRGETPQLIAANDHLMKSVMRVIITSRQALTPIYVTVLRNLTGILGEISKNPSNPKFNHFTFESISALARFVTAGTPSTLPEFESALFPPFQVILQNDISEFTPFVFQILSQLLELHAEGDFPEAYRVLLPPMLTPALWESKGNVPALVRLLRAFLARGAPSIVEANQLPPMLGIFQHLVGSKANDAYGFELLESIVEYVPLNSIRQYMSNPVFMLLLTRLQTSKTDKFSQGLLRFICFMAAINKPGLDVDGVVRMLDGVQPQPGLFGQVLPVLFPEVQKAPEQNRKVIAVGLVNILTHSLIMVEEPHVRAWSPTLEALLKLFLLPATLSKNVSADADEIEVADLEETGYQASFSKLGASERVRPDPVAHVADPRAHLARQLSELSQAKPGQIRPLVEAVDPEFAQPFLAYLSSNGFELR